MARVGASLGNALGVDRAHDLLAAGEGRDRIAVPHRLGEGGEIAAHTHQLLCAAAGHAEAGLDLVHDHHDAVSVAQLARGLEVLDRGRDAAAVALDRLDQEGGELASVPLEYLLEVLDLV